MIVSIAIDVLLVCIGSHRDFRNDPRGFRPTCLPVLEPIGPFPPMALPRASTTRPNSSSPTGTSTMAPVRFTMSPSLISLSFPNTTTPTLSGSRFRDIPCTKDTIEHQGSEREWLLSPHGDTTQQNTARGEAAVLCFTSNLLLSIFPINNLLWLKLLKCQHVPLHNLRITL